MDAGLSASLTKGDSTGVRTGTPSGKVGHIGSSQQHAGQKSNKRGSTIARRASQEFKDPKVVNELECADLARAITVFPVEGVIRGTESMEVSVTLDLHRPVA